MEFFFYAVVVAVGTFVEAWMLMLGIGMLHIHILPAIHAISLGVAFQFVLLSVPVQALGVVMGALNSSS